MIDPTRPERPAEGAIDRWLRLHRHLSAHVRISWPADHEYKASLYTLEAFPNGAIGWQCQAWEIAPTQVEAMERLEKQLAERRAA